MFIHQDDYIQTLFVVFTTWKRLLKNEEEEEEEEKHTESSFFDRSYKYNMVSLYSKQYSTWNYRVLHNEGWVSGVGDGGGEGGLRKS